MLRTHTHTHHSRCGSSFRVCVRVVWQCTRAHMTTPFNSGPRHMCNVFKLRHMGARVHAAAADTSTTRTHTHTTIICVCICEEVSTVNAPARGTRNRSSHNNTHLTYHPEDHRGSTATATATATVATAAVRITVLEN